MSTQEDPQIEYARAMLGELVGKAEPLIHTLTAAVEAHMPRPDPLMVATAARYLGLCAASIMLKHSKTPEARAATLKAFDMLDYLTSAHRLEDGTVILREPIDTSGFAAAATLTDDPSLFDLTSWEDSADGQR